MKSQPILGASKASISYRETDGDQKDLKSIEPVPGPSNLYRKIENRRLPENSISNDETEDEWQPSGRSSDEVSIISHDSIHEHDVSDTEISKSNISTPCFTPFDISPPPSAPAQTRSSRPSQGVTILTSTPNYNLSKEKAVLKKVFKREVKSHCLMMIKKLNKMNEKEKKTKKKIR